MRAESAPDHSARNDYVFIIADTAGIIDSEDESYISSVSAATALSASPSTPLSSSLARAVTENHNNSNFTRPTSSTSARTSAATSANSWGRERYRGERRFSPIRPNVTLGPNRFRFQWRHSRRTLRLRSRFLRFRGSH